MTLIVEAAFQLSNQQIAAAKIGSVAETWTDMLFGIIPEDKLHHAFKEAFKKHTGATPISAYEMKNTWEKIELDKQIRISAQEHDETKATARQATAIEKCWFDKKYHNHANLLGEFYVVDPYDTHREILIPCFYCRREDHDKFIFERGKLHAGEQPFADLSAALASSSAGFTRAVDIIERWGLARKPVEEFYKNDER
jgi:hypothetical protein